MVAGREVREASPPIADEKGSLGHRLAPRAYVTVALLGVVLIAGGVLAVRTLRSERPCSEVDLARIPVDSVSSVPCAKAFVVRQDQEIKVFVGETPHLPGEPLEYDKRRRVFLSPFHEEVYGLDGRRITGPGRPKLWECEIVIERDRLVIVGAAEARTPEEIAERCKRTSGSTRSSEL